MLECDALYNAVLAAPEDDAPRLVYADWLDEHGRADRAEFIREQVACSRDPRRPDVRTIQLFRSLLHGTGPELHEWTLGAWRVKVTTPHRRAFPGYGFKSPRRAAEPLAIVERGFVSDVRARLADVWSCLDVLKATPLVRFGAIDKRPGRCFFGQRKGGRVAWVALPTPAGRHRAQIATALPPVLVPFLSGDRRMGFGAVYPTAIDAHRDLSSAVCGLLAAERAAAPARLDVLGDPGPPPPPPWDDRPPGPVRPLRFQSIGGNLSAR
jgi:uncharacterized protein (TIGR02996 family)